MPLNTRDLWLVLKAQDQTNRALNTFSRNVKNAGDTVRMAQLQAEKAAVMGTIAQKNLANEVLRAQIGTDTAAQATVKHSQALKKQAIAAAQSEVAQMRAQKAVLASAAATLKANNAQQSQIDGIAQMSKALDDQITKRRMFIAQQQGSVAAEQAQVNAIQGSINARKGQIAANNNYIAQQRQVVANINDEIKQVEAHNRSLQEAEKRTARMANGLGMVSQTATAMGFAISAAGVATAIGIKQAIDVAVEYERQVRATATQVDNFSGNLDELADIGRRLAQEIAVPFKEIQPALFDIFSSMEVNVKDAEQLLRSFSKAAVAGQVDIQDVSRATIGLLNAFQRPASDVNRLLDIQFQLVQEGIGTYEEWNQRIGLVTPSAVRAGQSIEVMIAALAASTRMGLSAARSGTAVARAFDALSNPVTVKNLKNLGVNVLDATGKFRPFNEVLRDFRTYLMSLPESKRLETILDVFKGAGGTIEARRFLQNILLGAGNLETFDMILKETANSAGSMEKAYGLMSDSAAAQTQLLSNQWMLLKESVGKALTPAFATVVKWLAEIVGKFNALPDSTKRTIAFIIALAAVFATVIGPLLVLIGIVAAFAAAFVVAGEAILVVVGLMTLFIAGAAAFAAIFVLLVKHSETFNNYLDLMKSNFNALKSVVMSVAASIKAEFDKNLKVPLENLWYVIDKQLGPVFMEFMKMWSDTLLPKLKEAGRILSDMAGSAFKQIGNAITNYVIPAIQTLVQLWNEHKEQIKPVLELLAQAIKWFIIIAAVIVGIVAVAIVGVLGGAIALIVGAFGGLVVAAIAVWTGLKWLWDRIVQFGTWIGGVFVDLWNSASDGVSAAWNGLTAAAQTVWGWLKTGWQAVVDFFVMIWDGVSNYLASVWNWFWNSAIGGLVKSVWDLITSLVTLGFTMLQFIFSWGLAWIVAGWNATWENVMMVFHAIWDPLTEYAKSVWQGWVNIWLTIWPPIRNTFASAWNFIKNEATNAWNTIKFLWTGAVSILAGLWGYIQQGAQNTWNNIKNYIINPMKDAYNAVVGVIGDIRGAFAGAGEWLYEAGRAIVRGLINGIKSAIDSLRNAVDELTGIIADHLPGSPVKKGPLKVLNHGYAGGQIVQMIADGMESKQRALDVSANFAAGTVAGSMGPDLADSAANMGGVTKNYYITQNITTQEVNPIRQATALGWEVTTVM